MISTDKLVLFPITDNVHCGRPELVEMKQIKKELDKSIKICYNHFYIATSADDSVGG
jgi:hypothetical protein